MAGHVICERPKKNLWKIFLYTFFEFDFMIFSLTWTFLKIF